MMTVVGVSLVKTNSSVIRYEPLDLDGSVNCFWNHDMVGGVGEDR